MYQAHPPTITQGYQAKAPTEAVAAMDARMAERVPCEECGGPMVYEPWSRPGSYIATAVCGVCGYVVEF